MVSAASKKSPNARFVPWSSIALHALVAGVLPYAFTKWVIQTSTLVPVAVVEQRAVHVSKAKIVKSWNLPVPQLHKHKIPPTAHYTGQCLDDPENEEQTPTWSQHRVDVHIHIAPDHVPEVAEKLEDNSTLGEGFDGYQPAGQHMLIDIQNVDPKFLMDTEALAKSIVETTTNSGLTLLSYHCHDLQPPMGVSCVGVLLESHVSVHTWPSAGIIALDLFTCGPASLLPLVPLLEGLFAKPSDLPDAPRPVARWLYKKRGYRNYEGIMNADHDIVIADQEGTDIVPVAAAEAAEAGGVGLERFLLGWKGYRHKDVVVSAETKFQEVAVFEMSHSHIPLSREADPSMKLNKKLFLDNVAQSSLHGLEAYHEALVHPAMLAHASPKRALIIGGGEGAALREVLKHKTVETCTMLEIDGELIQLARKHLKEWNDCSDFSSAPEGDFFSCFDEPRAQVNTVDAFGWVMDRYGDKATIEEEKYDVIIMDALEPASQVAFSDQLYGDQDFIKALTNALTPSGIMVVQLGITDAADFDRITRDAPLVNKFTKLLHKNGAQAMKAYGEGHGQFLAPWNFRVVFMDAKSEALWYSDAPKIDLELSKRALGTKSGSSPFSYFDGAMHQTYQYSSRAEEEFFCKLDPTPVLCQGTRGYDQDFANVPAASLKRFASAITNAGNGVFFHEGATEGSYIALEESTQSMMIPPLAYHMIGDLAGVSPRLANVEDFISAYGFPGGSFGLPSRIVDTGITTLANHGCNGTNNIGTQLDGAELTNDVALRALSAVPRTNYFFDPVADRTFLLHSTGAPRVLFNVKAGEELLDNYMRFSENDTAAQDAEYLSNMCLQEERGNNVLDYEAEFENQPINQSTVDKPDVVVRGTAAAASQCTNCALD